MQRHRLRRLSHRLSEVGHTEPNDGPIDQTVCHEPSTSVDYLAKHDVQHCHNYHTRYYVLAVCHCYAQCGEAFDIAGVDHGDAKQKIVWLHGFSLGNVGQGSGTRADA